MKLWLILLFLQLWGNVKVSFSQNANTCDIGVLHPHLFVAGMPPLNEKIQVGHKLRFVCGGGFILVGSVETECSQTGQWLPRFPTCSEKACNLSLPLLMGTTYNTNNQSLFLPGETVRVTCGERFWIIDTKTTEAVVTCKDDGEWDTRPVCHEVTCSAYLPDDHLSWYTNRNAWGRNRLGDTVTYSCTRSYERTDGVEHATCTRDGWTPKPLCQGRKGCGSPPPVTDGDTVGLTTSQYEDGATVEYTCFDKYTLKGVPFKTCNNGVWTGEMTCMKPCTVMAEMMNRHNIEYAYGDRNKLYVPHEDHMTFVCKPGTRKLHQEQMRKQCIDGQIDLPTCG